MLSAKKQDLVMSQLTTQERRGRSLTFWQHVPYLGDELHHVALAMEILPRFDNILFYLHCCCIYMIDKKTNPTSMHKIVEPEP
ncbi:hypothetical protein P8452_61866 [Trifolium repens]|nr:hypothetical protein P8452_61866 [Trifolium repens]